MERDYKTFKVTDFLDDSFFIEWVRDNSSLSREFWNEWELSAPANLLEMQAAKEELTLILAANRISPATGDEAQVWESIQKTLDLQNEAMPGVNKSSGKVFKMNFKYWTAAASIILLLGVGFFYFSKRNSTSIVKSIPEKVIENDLKPGGNKAILTLADGQQIILDSSQNGSLGQQGNASVIKLDDGRVAYKNLDEKLTDIVYNTISTPRGGQYQVDLADGSKVWLNAASSIRFPTRFSGGERKVEITGEAYFEVAKKPGVPFEVLLANGSKVQVLGTHFNVMSYENEKDIETTLFEGSVRFVNEVSSVIIKPGQQVVMHESTAKLAIIDQVNEDAVLAWKNGKFYFNEVDIQTVMNQIARWYDVDVEYRGKVDKVFAGTISRNVSASNIFKILEATGGVSFQIEGKKVIVSP